MQKGNKQIHRQPLILFINHYIVSKNQLKKFHKFIHIRWTFSRVHLVLSLTYTWYACQFINS